MRPSSAAAAFLGFVLVLDGGRVAAQPCASDDALAEASSILVLSSAALSAQTVTDALREAGSDLPSAHAARFPDTATRNADRAAWLGRLARDADAPLVCGAATSSSGDEVWIAAARAGGLAPTNDDATFRVTLAPGFVSPTVVLQDAGGQLHYEDVDGDSVSISSGYERPLLVQLVARGPEGPRPVAERRLGGQVPAPVVSVPDPSAVLTGLDALRRHEGAAPLRVNQLLGRAATSHAGRVCAEGRVAHELIPGEGPEERLASEGVRARVVGEAVARGRDTADALRTMLASPSHHLTLTDRRFTDAAIGLSSDAAGRTCLVVVLAAWPRVVPAPPRPALR